MNGKDMKVEDYQKLFDLISEAEARKLPERLQFEFYRFHAIRYFVNSKEYLERDIKSIEELKDVKNKEIIKAKINNLFVTNKIIEAIKNIEFTEE